MRIDAEAEAVLREVEASSKGRPAPRNAAETLAQARSDTASLKRFSAAPPSSVRTESAEAPGRGGHSIPLRLYRAPDARHVLLWLHGGGAIAGSLDTHEAPLMALAERTGRVVVSVGYRLAPEARYPAQREDCLEAARFVAGTLVASGETWAIGGDSIGGLYATATARRLRDEGCAIVVASTDHEQLAALCNRVIVTRGGIVTHEISGAPIAQERITELCYGGSESGAAPGWTH